jgi:hypothetical protein
MPSFEGVLPSGGDLGGTSDTLLVISGMGSFQYQARGLQQTLFPIKQTQQQVRDVNANLIDISNPAFRKYGSKITCKDVDAPPLDNVWNGMTVIVQCVVELAYPNGNAGSPYKPIVPGSSYVNGSFTFYRPLLEMMVLDVQRTTDEWQHDNHWELSLEEV